MHSLLLLTALAAPLAPPASAPEPPAAPSREVREPVRFSAGERLTYTVRFGPMKVGTGSMEITGVERVRDRDAFHAVFRLSGGTLFYKVNDVLESWIDTTSLVSLRFVKDQREGRRERATHFEIFPERRRYAEAGREERESVDAPLDDASFLYFVRTLPLEVGATYELDRYFKPDRNPVTVHVARRERITVPAGTFDALVLRPTIRTSGLLAESKKTEVWLSDDEHRVVLRVASKLPFGTISLQLASYELAAGTGMLASLVE
ncbi:MAG TPA: DUF3108 domain-containing protein [Gemmatimonadaceae bacterium]|nr:DUF3108 domain-containing protein [Gemmatimonadaceae bacterium]